MTMSLWVLLIVNGVTIVFLLIMLRDLIKARRQHREAVREYEEIRREYSQERKAK